MASYQQLTLGDLETNCYLVWDEDSREAMVIDPADSAEIISEQLLTQNLKLKLICLTHGHFDHLMAAAELKLNFKTKIGLNSKDEFLWKRQTNSAKHFTGGNFLKLGEIIKINIDLGHSKSFTLGKESVEVIGCPGHTPGSVAFYLPAQKWLFSGDLIFFEGLGATNYSYGDAVALKKSVETIVKLPSKTLVLPGHGRSFYLDSLR